MNEEELIEYVVEMKKHFIIHQRYEIAAGLRTIEKNFRNKETESTIEYFLTYINDLMNELSLVRDRNDVYKYVTPLVRDEKLKKLFNQ